MSMDLLQGGTWKTLDPMELVGSVGWSRQNLQHLLDDPKDVELARAYSQGSGIAERDVNTQELENFREP